MNKQSLRSNKLDLKKIWSYLAVLQSVITLFLYHIFTLVSTSQTTLVVMFIQIQA